MKKNGVFIAVISAVLGCVLSAHAITVTVSDNLTNNMLISQGQTVTGQFNINTVLAGDSNYNLPYNISSATASFTFYDDNDVSYSSSSTSTTLTNYVYSSHYRTYYQVQNTIDYYVDAYENVYVSIGAQYSIDGTNWYQIQTETVTNGSSTTTYYHPDSYSCGTWGTSACGDWYYTYVTTTYTSSDNTSGYTGQFTVDIAFDYSNIEDLAMDGIIDFTIGGQAGDVILNDGQLTAEVNPNPASSVPEPATLLLVGLGLAGLAAGIRKLKK